MQMIQGAIVLSRGVCVVEGWSVYLLLPVWHVGDVGGFGSILSPYLGLLFLLLLLLFLLLFLVQGVVLHTVEGGKVGVGSL